MLLEGKVAIVTGAGRGIGRGIAMALAAAGAHTVCAARTHQQLAETVALIQQAGGRAEACVLDVTDRTATERMARQVQERHGRIDILVNNAGSFSAIGPVWEVDPETWWHDVTVNLYGTFLCSRAVLPYMLARRDGTIINLSGGGAAGPFAYGSGYGSSKAAVVRFTDCLAMEVRESNIRVYVMGPGLVRTAMTEYQLTSPDGQRYLARIAGMFAQGRDVPPERAGRLAVLLASNTDMRLSGRVFSVQDLDAWPDILAQAGTIAAEDSFALRLRR